MLPSGRSSPLGSLTRLIFSFIFVIYFYHPVTKQKNGAFRSFPLLDIFPISNCQILDISEFSYFWCFVHFWTPSTLNYFNLIFSTKCVLPQRSVVHRSVTMKFYLNFYHFDSDRHHLSFILLCNSLQLSPARYI